MSWHNATRELINRRTNFFISVGFSKINEQYRFFLNKMKGYIL